MVVLRAEREEGWLLLAWLNKSKKHNPKKKQKTKKAR